MNNIYKTYAVFNTKYSSYISNEGYHYQLQSLDHVKFESLDEALDCANFLISKGVFSSSDLVVHELITAVGQTTAVTTEE